MSETEFIVREAKVEDCAGILSLIKALAKHEKAADTVEMTEEGSNEKVSKSLLVLRPITIGTSLGLYRYNVATQKGRAMFRLILSLPFLKRDGFGEERLFHCLVAERRKEAGSGKLVGFALYFFVYSTRIGGTTYLEDLYVLPEERGKGIGTTLWKSVVKIALRRNCQRFDLVCLGWNESMCFYKKNGAIDLTATEDFHVVRLKRKEMEELASKVDGENIQWLA